ncbi:unnamed protein product [Paramecium sonneborni]|uniref:Potassium channel domain-containing protein n=1 Tax=Paramecium sonneborni TaxID=65129 RepID=A0A8S1QN59_9CILI|nr:unnamed protein product [Paramecium sonneborni]
MFNIEFDQDFELRAVQNEDFEQQYLDNCLRESRKEPNTTYPHISRSISSKSIEAECLHKTPDTPFDEVVTSAQSSELLFRKIVQQQDRRSSIPNAGTSLMCSFYIRRFIEKISSSRKRILSMNEIHFNLIEDKAADMQNLFNYQHQCKIQGSSFGKMKAFLRKDTGLRNKSLYEQMKSRLKIMKKNIFDIITTLVNKIPIIQPESRFKMIWDFFASFFRIILVLLIPLEIAFDPGILFVHYIYLTALIIVILQIDFLIRINTLSYRNGAAIQNRWDLLIHQLKQEFLTDFSTSSVLIIFMIVSEINNNNINFFLLVVLAQFKYIYETFAKSDQISYLTRPLRGIINLIKLIFTLLFILHLFSCIWFWFSQISLDDSWIRYNNLDIKTWELQYLESLYFAVVTMLTIGYGDNVPKNSIEKIVTIIFILGACLWFSYSVNFIGGIIDDIFQNQIERNRKMRVINKYMDQRKIPFNMKHKIKEYLTFRWKEDDEVDLEIEQTLLEQLSDELKEELDKEVHKIFIKKSAFLQNFGEDFKDALSKSIKRKIIPPQNTFSIDFDNQINLCFIEQGILLYQHPDRKQRAKMNSQIKQEQFFCVREFIIQSPNIEYFKSNGYVSLLILSKKDFLDTIKNYPEDFQKFCEIKEQMNLNMYPPQIENGVFCPACLKFDHNLKNCPQIQYTPDKEVILKRYLLPREQKRKYKNRNNSKRFQSEQTIKKARLEKDLIQQFAQVFQSDNIQLIQEQQKIQMVYEQESFSSSADCSPCLKVENEGKFSAAVSKSKKLINIDQQPQVINTSKLIEVRANLHQALQNRKQSIFNLNISSGLGRSPKSMIICQKDCIKESDESDEKSNSSSQSQKSENKQNKNLFTVADFNDNMIENITNLYHQLQRELEFNENDSTIQKAYFQIEPLYWQINQQRLYDFEVMASYDYFFKNSNFNEIIKNNHQNVNLKWQLQFLEKLQKYMLYPFIFIQKYLNKKRNLINSEQIKHNPSKRLNSRLNTLKNSLKLKKKTVILKPILKLGKVVPEI